MPETVQLHGREAVLAGIPVTEHRMTVAGIETAVLVGGDGPPMVLLPGPGESALWWARVLPALVERYRVIAPDLPGTGESKPGIEDAQHAIRWLEALLERTCDAKAILIGHVVGGALAAQYALRNPDRVDRLVLVDSLGLRRFLPSPAFGYRLFRFLAKPNEERYGPFLDQCMFDADGMRQGFGDRWEAFSEYYLESMQDPAQQDALGDLIKHFGAKRIDGLDGLEVPAALIWGRHDKATPLRVAEKASTRYGWPLHVVEESGDDPKLERPQEFLEALEAVVGP